MIFFYAIVGIFAIILAIIVAYFLIRGYGFKDFFIYSFASVIVYIIAFTILFISSFLDQNIFVMKILSYGISAAAYFIIYTLTCVILFGIVSVLPNMEFQKNISSTSYYGLAVFTFIFLFIIWCLLSYVGSHESKGKTEPGIISQKYLPSPTKVFSEAVRLLLIPTYEINNETIKSLEGKITPDKLEVIKTLRSKNYTKSELSGLKLVKITDEVTNKVASVAGYSKLKDLEKLKNKIFIKENLLTSLKTADFNKEEIEVIFASVTEVEFSNDDINLLLKYSATKMEFYYHLWVSIYRIFTGFGLAVVFAVPLGILMGSFKSIEAIFNPLFSFVRYMPPTAFISLLIIWTAIDSVPAYLIFIGVFFYLLVLIMDHVANVPRELLETAYTLGAVKLEVLTMVIFPHALPGILDSCKAMIGAAWTYLIAAELVGGMGIGYTIMKAQRFLRTPEVFVSIIVIGIIGIITNALFELAYRWLFPWKISEKSR